MRQSPRKISLAEWDTRYAEMKKEGLPEPAYGGRLSRHVNNGDYRLKRLSFDNSPASLDLWNFLLTEDERLHESRKAGRKIVGTMKDLGTVPVMAYAFPNITAFYPDGAWWIPCVMEMSAGLLRVADSLGVDESFCPVRAMLGAFVTEAHFPIPDLLVCSVGATCDDFSAIAQRLEAMGHAIVWWEMPHRRTPLTGEPSVRMPGGLEAPVDQVAFVRGQLAKIRHVLEELAGAALDDDQLSAAIRVANEARDLLERLRRLVFTAKRCPLPATELLIAEMLTIHFCSDRDECFRVLGGLLAEVELRVAAGEGLLDADAARIFWVNPVADVRALTLFEECGGRLCGTDNMFLHALDRIPSTGDPLECLAMSALSDPMVGSATDRALRICSDAKTFGAEGIVVSRIPGASHCALEGTIIADVVRSRSDLPVVELEVPPVSDAFSSSLSTRMQALVESIKQRRRP